MKAFFERYSYESVRLLLNQVAISMFGFALAMTAVNAESDVLLLWSSIAAIAFYLLLTYSTAWKTGSGDKLSIEYGKLPFRPLRGLTVSLLANSINYLLAILIAVGALCGVPALEDIPRTVALLSQGMYMGVLADVQMGGEALNEAWWIYLVTPLPAMLVASVAYVMGAKDIHLTNINTPELPASDRPTRQELREKRELDKKSRK
jgi:hypothetical protein